MASVGRLLTEEHRRLTVRRVSSVEDGTAQVETTFETAGSLHDARLPMPSRSRSSDLCSLVLGKVRGYTGRVGSRPRMRDRLFVLPRLEIAVSRSEEPAPGLGSRSAGWVCGQVGEAVADLAVRLGVSPAVIEVISHEEVSWPDAALGCPEPGRFYAQVLVNGSRIVLGSGGRRYEYHCGGGRPPFLCEHPRH